MRRRSYEEWRRAFVTLQPSAIFLEILRNELGVLLAEGQPEAVEFATLSVELQRELRAVCSDEEFEYFQAMKNRLMDIRLEPLTFDAAAYAEAFERTIHLPQPT